MIRKLTFKSWCAVPLWIGAAFVLYGNTLGHSFHFDDFIFIVQNSELTNPFDIMAIWNEGSAPTRFITYLTFAWNYYFHQYDVAGYHVVNILIHGINASLVFGLAALLAKHTRGEESRPGLSVNLWAATVALIFLCHPLQTQAITYICQRFASLATLFYLASVLCYCVGRVKGGKSYFWYGLAVTSAMVGMFTKQITMTLPIMILAMEWIVFRKGQWHWQSLGQQWRLLLPAILLVGLIPSIYSFNVISIIGREYPSLSHRGDTLNAWTYFLTQSQVVWTYIRLLVFPVEQNLLYDFPTMYQWWNPRVILGFGSLFGILYGVLRVRKQHPLLAMGVLWFFIALLVESSIIPIRHVIFEHRMYLPMFGAAMIGADLMFNFVPRRRVSYMIVPLIVMVLCFLTVNRNAIWKDGVTLWSDVVRKSPQLIRPYTHLATAYLNQRDFNRAIEVYSQAINVDPEKAESYNNRGNAYAFIRKYDLATTDYEKALQLDSTLEKTYNNLGTIYNRRKQFDLALQNFDQALALNPKNAGAYFNRANVFLQQNELDKAFQDYSRSIDANQFQKKAYYYRSQIFATRGQYENALHDILRAQKLGVKVDDRYVTDLQERIEP